MRRTLHLDELERRNISFGDLRRDLELGLLPSDDEFDSIYPTRMRELSNVHWTPVEVAAEVSRFLVRDEDSSVLDVGSGVGKFCLVSAMVSQGRYLGVERRGDLVNLARYVSKQFHLSNVLFREGDAFDIDWNDFSSIYLYNPFYEQIAHPHLRIDANVELTRENFDHFVEAAENKLRLLVPGTRVATYNGFGGKIPESFQCVWSSKVKECGLAFWEKKG